MIATALVIAVLVAVALCVWLLGKLLAIVFPQGTSGTVRVAALGITLVLWSGSIRATLDVLYKLARMLVDHVRGVATTEDWFDILIKAPFLHLLFALIMLFLLIRALQSLSTGVKPTWLTTLQKFPSPFWQNSLVLIVFFVGIYLSVASLCTIPSLQINQPFTDTERNQIVSQINGYKTADDTFRRVFPETLPPRIDEFAYLRGIVAAAPGGKKIPFDCPTQEKASSSPMPTSPQVTSPAAVVPVVPTPTPSTPAGNTITAKAAADRSDLKIQEPGSDPQQRLLIIEAIEEYDKFRCDSLSSYQAMRREVLNGEKAEGEKATSEIESNIAFRLTGRDRGKYIYDLKIAYQNLIGESQAILSRCMSEVQTSSTYWQKAAQTLEISLDPRRPAQSAFQPGLFESTRGEDFCHAPLPMLSTIDASTLDPQLGIFSNVFGWLEHSNSLALGVICGMLGVGLVGCIVSSFVRQQPARQAGEPWIADTFPVIVRGFTAAIVVYLAIEGGLNIFSTTSTQANPYVLLFACLVGAVFSEDVWVAAHKRLESADSRSPSGGQKPTGPVNKVPPADQSLRTSKASPDAENKPSVDGAAPEKP
jgi:hypothetical protein